MTIDPMNAPIFGDAAQAEPPRLIKIATSLLLVQVGVLAGYRLYVAFDGSFPLYLVPLLLAVWFALSIRSGHNWARTASSVLSCLLIAMTALMIDFDVLGLSVLAASSVLLLAAIGMMWQADVNDYFGA